MPSLGIAQPVGRENRQNKLEMRIDPLLSEATQLLINIYEALRDHPYFYRGVIEAVATYRNDDTQEIFNSR